MADQDALALLRADMAFISKRMDEVMAYVSTGHDRHAEIISKLAVIENKQDGMTAYQAQCDTDRKDLGIRLTELETSQRTALRIFGSGAFLTIVLTIIQMFKR